MANVVKKGAQGNEVRELQQKLVQLGYAVDVDGIFGPKTEDAVRHLQKSFGYNVDGMVGDATNALIAQQTALGWRSDRVAAQGAPAPGGTKKG